MIHCSKDEQHIVNKLVEIFRSKEDLHKEALTQNINFFCGDKLWIRMERPERRKNPITRSGMTERRIKVHVYDNENGSWFSESVLVVDSWQN
ncbi:MAG: hypothetical protein D8M57_16140 [Candidatus Scalindua sp. AMX11]|nr:hypothetical protein [Planctomycetota bacterium]RZV69032.1 MAG: hypothetical protein EX341_16305 [Candidatus Scalindua sp. SCAELEC01]TDE63863.1 MAG: hypothetical protein D8M57_16140 [Candidatus Scalindua sp. AMX11]GJQ60423.1 MAG: hypothetical protein SCALA701_32240 [Candidatus Scalindua sp.]